MQVVYLNFFLIALFDRTTKEVFLLSNQQHAINS